MDVSHELRTPLNAIRAPLELLAAGAAGPMSSEARRLVSDAVAALAALERAIDGAIDEAEARDGSPLGAMARSGAMKGDE